MKVKLDSAKRILNVAFICHYYHVWASIEDYKIILKSKSTYEENERLSLFFNTIFKTNTTVTDFMYSNDEVCNKIIENHKVLEMYQNNYIMDKQIMDSFCKSVYYGNKCIFLKLYCFKLAPFFLECMNYAMGNINKESFLKYLKSNEVKKSLLGFDLRFYRLAKRTFFDVDENFKKIKAKQGFQN